MLQKMKLSCKNFVHDFAFILSRNWFMRVCKYIINKRYITRDFLIVGECVRFLFTTCEGSLDERVSAANE